ncbi:ABC transporter permease [Paenibacillus baekrokdamisoli]|uniref:ABC transporter permease n=1 Tax=Paenibacillus baekrokdamisoli TaxID=1712516 RepID=A0A3G9IWJ2_9BACL|nr:ABC transporter permease [Paenibacillus baekrokdamisoli]MBB3073293.1 ABC-type nitrate/sulfonate/bicarbonate transport system permease component [Paenibacillus baekrokdamisoli]BBH23277.1 ABC transporter permease [Paenibacillus baekrokdamisoli]
MDRIKKMDQRLYPILTLLFVVVLWQLIVTLGHVPLYILPSPLDTVDAFIGDFGAIAGHVGITMYESMLGFTLSIALAFILGILMDSFTIVKKSLYPILIVSQTIPTIAITPLLIVWFGFGLLPKILIIVMVCFFPICISLVDGFEKVDKDYLNLFHSYKASKLQTFVHLKLPYAMVNFFSGLKIAATYMIMAAIIGEWQGGTKGIGVYMVRTKNAYALDKVFAAILVIVIISVVFISLINFIAKKTTHWK